MKASVQMFAIFLTVFLVSSQAFQYNQRRRYRRRYKDNKRILPKYFPIYGFHQNKIKDENVISFQRQNKEKLPTRNKRRDQSAKITSTYFHDNHKKKAENLQFKNFQKSTRKIDDLDALTSRQMEIDLPLVTVDKVKRKLNKNNFFHWENRVVTSEQNRMRTDLNRKNFFETGIKL